MDARAAPGPQHPPMLQRPPRATVLLLITYLVATLLLEPTQLTTGPRLVDFGTYYHAAHQYQTGQPVYDATTANPYGATGQFKYPPLALLPFLPLSHLPFTTAGVLWTTLMATAYLSGMLALINSHWELTRRQTATVAVALLGFAPILTAFKNGQITGLLVGVFAVSATSTDRRAGALAALPVFIKPYMATGWAYLLENTTRIVVLIATTLLLWLGNIAVGPELTASYLNSVLLEAGAGRATYQQIPSTWHSASFYPWHLLGEYSLIARLMVVFVTLFVSLWAARTDRPAGLVGALGFAAIPLVAPAPGADSLAMLAPAAILLFAHIRNRPAGYVVLAGVLMAQAHPYTLEATVRYASSLTGLLPAAQPGLWACLLLYTVALREIATEPTDCR